VSDGLRGGRERVGFTHLLLQAGAVQALATGAALIDHDEPVGAESGRQLVGHRADELHAGLAGATGEEQQRAQPRVRVAGGRDLEPQHARHLPGSVQRHGQVRAGESGLARARVRTGERGAGRRRPGLATRRHRRAGRGQQGQRDHRRGRSHGARGRRGHAHAGPSGTAIRVCPCYSRSTRRSIPTSGASAGFTPELRRLLSRAGPPTARAWALRPVGAPGTRLRWEDVIGSRSAAGPDAP
jgi:hypothetical protein